jgi:hypothetical protein
MAKELEQFQQSERVQPVSLPDVQVAGQELADRITQFGTGITAKIKKVSDEQDNAEKAAAQIQVRDGITHIREKVLDPQTFSDSSIDNYDAQVKGLTKGIISSANPKIKAAIANFASYYGDKNRDVVVNRVQSLKKNQLVGGLQEYVDKTKDDAVSAKFSGEIVPDPEDKDKVISKGDILIGQINKNVNMAMNSGLITPKEAFAYKESAQKSYEEADYLHQFQQALAQGHDSDKWLSSFDKDKNISPAIKQKVQIQAAGTTNELQQSFNTNKNLIQQQADDTIRQVSTGNIDVNSPHVNNVKLRTSALPEQDQQEIHHRLTSASVFSVAKKEIKFIPFIKRNSLLDKLKPAIDDPGFKFKDKINSALQKESDRLESEFKKDPFQYVSDNPDVTRAFQSRMTAANDGSTKIQPVQLQSIDPLAVALEKERMMGANNQQLSIMSKATSGAIIARLDSFPDVKSKIQFINDIFDSYGKYKNIANRDLKKAGAPQNILDLANLNNVDGAKPFLQGIYNSVEQKHEIQKALNDRNVAKERYSDFKEAVVDQLQPLINTIGNTAESQETKNNMVDLASTAAAGYFLTNKSGSVNDAAKKITDAIYNSRYSGYVKEARIPINVSLSNAKDAMYAVEKEIPQMNFVPLSRSFSGIDLTKAEQVEEDMHIIKAGHWRTIGDDSGVYWTDANGFTPQVVEKGEKHRLEIHWKDLQDSTSELHGLMAKHQRMPLDPAIELHELMAKSQKSKITVLDPAVELRELMAKKKKKD